MSHSEDPAPAEIPEADADEEVSIGQLSDDDDEIIGSITSAALAALSLHNVDQPRPHSAMSGARASGGRVLIVYCVRVLMYS